jgi:lysozyme
MMTRRARRFVWTAGLLAAIATLGLLLAPFVYPRLELAPFWHEVTGVDVSNHQGVIDWKALAASGVGFAYIKATEGGDFRDKSFARNWVEAEAAGVSRGAYHFATLCSATDEARNFIETVPKDPKALPPVVDVEQIGACTATLTPADNVAMLREFLDTLEKHYGRRPLIYTTPEFDSSMLEGMLAGERFWVRSLVLPPRFRRDQWVIWQYHNKGTRPGIAGPVDLNAFRGTRRDFDAFVKAGT